MESRPRTYGKLKPVYAAPVYLAGQVEPKVPDRPARVQVEQKVKLQQAEHLGEYNIWYGRYLGVTAESWRPSWLCFCRLGLRVFFSTASATGRFGAAHLPDRTVRL